MNETKTCDKIVGKQEFNKEKGRYMIKKQIRTFYYDPISQHTLSNNPFKVREEWAEIPNLFKKVSLQILLKKVAVNDISLEQMIGYFENQLDVSVLSDEMYKFQFLSICEGRIFIHNVEGSQTCPLSLSGNQEGIEKKFGTPKRITNEKALEMMEKGSPIFENLKGEYRILVG